MSNQQVVTAKVHEILTEHLNLLAPVAPGDRIMADLGGDSLDVVEVVMKLEQHYSLDLDKLIDEPEPTVATIIETIATAAN